MRATRYLVATILAASVAATAVVGATGGNSPKLLDRNQSWVLNKPKLHNLLWDDNWTAHNSISKGSIHKFAVNLPRSSWIDSASEYGVTSLTFSQTVDGSSTCGARAPTTVTTAKILEWATCMVSHPNKTGVIAPTVRVPISNDLYLVYLPERTTISDSLTIDAFTVLGHTFGPFSVSHRSCDDYGAFHALSIYLGGLFPITIIPTKCANGSLDNLTYASAHEIIEAATDPIPTAGWMNSSLSLGQRFLTGEAADICSSVGPSPTASIRRGGSVVPTYWSNSHGACVG